MVQGNVVMKHDIVISILVLFDSSRLRLGDHLAA